jgi:hypothetical protein
MSEENEESSTKEQLEGIGQVIAGELEIIGGILTADPITQAEGEFNVEAGNIHLEASEALEETESDEVEE